MAGSTPKAPKKIRATCPKCGPERDAYVMAAHEDTGGDSYVHWWRDYRVIKCGGCRNIQLQIVSGHSEDYEDGQSESGEPTRAFNLDYSYWPPLTKRQKPEWFQAIELKDRLLGDILTEIYQALDNDMPIAAAITMRTAFDRTTELIGIKPTLSFKDKMKALVTDGEIASKDLEVLNPLIEAGNAAAHRGWSPTAEELTTMVLILEALLHRAFVLKQQVAALAKRTPPKPPKA